MPKFKREKLTVRNDAGVYYHATVDINIDAEGIFYANIPDELALAFPEARNSRAAGCVAVSAKTFDALRSQLLEGMRRHIEPVVTEEIIIRYFVDASLGYAVGESGTLFSNGYAAGKEPYKYVSLGERSMSARPIGMQLKLGAKAVIKQTIAYGEKKKVSYTDYFKGESHLGFDNPAQKLNSFTGFGLPEGALEMPYTDEAAEFFYDMMMAMVTLTHKLTNLVSQDDALRLAIQQRQSAFQLTRD